MTEAQMRRLVPGQVIVSPTGKHRTVLTVRLVGRWSGSVPEKYVSVTVPILHCSWTKRPWTSLDYQTLRLYQATKTVLAINRWKVVKRIRDDELRCWTGKSNNRSCDCCEVVGKLQ